MTAAATTISEIRTEAKARFQELGFPTTTQEEWRFTNVAPIAKTAWAPAEPGADRCDEAVAAMRALEPALFDGWEGARLVLVNGRFAPGLSTLDGLPAGVRAGSLAEAIAGDPALVEAHLARLASYRDHAFVALNTAELDDGVFIHIPRGTALDRPIAIVYLSYPKGAKAATHPRALVVAGEGAQATILESFAGPEGEVYFTNAVTEIAAADGAVVDHVRVQRESAKAYHVATLHALAGRAANVATRSIAIGGALVRNDVRARLDGEGGECVLDGLYVAGAKRHIDNHTTIDHAKPHCSSREVYRGILDGQASGVFSGKIIVRPDAQKTDAKQTNKNLLLSDEAQIETKPQLEIFANDVKCTHGATVGRLDDEALFYLRARGIPAAAARSMLTFAFASDVVGRVKVEPVRKRLEAWILGRFGGGGGLGGEDGAHIAGVDLLPPQGDQGR